MSEDFERAKNCFLEGIAAFEAGRFADADAKFAASLALLPGRVSTLTNLAAARIKLGRPLEALEFLDQALAADPDNADAWSHRGVALGDLGRHDEAVRCFDRVLARDPGRAPAWHHRGIALNVLQRHGEALLALEQFLRLEPGNAEGWLRHGQTLQGLDRHPAALASFDKALAIDPGMAAAWSSRGSILKDQQRYDDATVAFEQAIACGGDPALNGYFLAAVAGRAAPATAPPQYVRGLFDDYAGAFDEPLVGVLRYRAHQRLAGQLKALGDRRYRQALDLGCGTGLCGPLVRPVADRIDGVDLSAGMLERARAQSVYAQLACADAAAYLGETDQRYDLVLAADVFIYIGDLAPVFGGVARVIEPGGVFCFSVELPEGSADIELKPSLRYGQSERYLRALAAQHGFAVLAMLPGPIREDQQRPVAGLYVFLAAH